VPPAPADSPTTTNDSAVTKRDSADSEGPPDSAIPRYRDVQVRVTEDGAPVAGALVIQGGGLETWFTDADGLAIARVDGHIEGDQVLIASHPEMRIWGVEVPDDEGEIAELELARFDPMDNVAYTFQDPGTPTDRGDSGKCAHCHVAINEAWEVSAHRAAASNPAVQDLYAGAAAALTDQIACEDAGVTGGRGSRPAPRRPAGAATWERARCQR